MHATGSGLNNDNKNKYNQLSGDSKLIKPLVCLKKMNQLFC